jgi:hypothetical protein
LWKTFKCGHTISFYEYISEDVVKKTSGQTFSLFDFPRGHGILIALVFSFKSLKRNGGPVTRFLPTISVCFLVLFNLFTASAWGASDFKEVMLIADYSSSVQERSLLCSLSVTNQTDGNNRLYDFQLTKSFEGNEGLMIEWDQDRITHVRAEPNFKDLNASTQGLIPSEQFSAWNTSNLPFPVARGEWIRAMVSRPGRYVEIKLSDAMWNAGPMDFLQKGYSIQVLLYDWNGVSPANYQTKSNLAVGDEVLLPFTVVSSGASPDFDDEVLSPFEYGTDLLSRGDTFRIDVTCK